MRNKGILMIVLCALVVSLASCKMVKESFGGGIDITKQEEVNKIPGIIGKIVKPEDQLLEIGFDFNNSQSFSQDAKEVKVVRSGAQELSINLSSTDSVGTRSLSNFSWYKDMEKNKQVLSKFDFSKISQYVADAIKQVDTNEYEYAGIDDYVLKVAQGGIKHTFKIQITKKGEASKRSGRRVITNYYEMDFEVTPDGKLINKSE